MSLVLAWSLVLAASASLLVLCLLRRRYSLAALPAWLSAFAALWLARAFVERGSELDEALARAQTALA